MINIKLKVFSLSLLLLLLLNVVAFSPEKEYIVTAHHDRILEVIKKEQM
jgi:hypothetical protein